MIFDFMTFNFDNWKKCSLAYARRIYILKLFKYKEKKLSYKFKCTYIPEYNRSILDQVLGIKLNLLHLTSFYFTSLIFLYIYLKLKEIWNGAEHTKGLRDTRVGSLCQA